MKTEGAEFANRLRRDQGRDQGRDSIKALSPDFETSPPQSNLLELCSPCPPPMRWQWLRAINQVCLVLPFRRLSHSCFIAIPFPDTRDVYSTEAYQHYMQCVMFIPISSYRSPNRSICNFPLARLSSKHASTRFNEEVLRAEPGL